MVEYSPTWTHILGALGPLGVPAGATVDWIRSNLAKTTAQLRGEEAASTPIGEIHRDLTTPGFPGQAPGGYMDIGVIIAIGVVAYFLLKNK